MKKSKKLGDWMSFSNEKLMELYICMIRPEEIKVKPNLLIKVNEDDVGRKENQHRSNLRLFGKTVFIHRKAI
jgi:hypothetical protein